MSNGFGGLRMKDLKPGDELIVDGGFTCVKPNSRVVVSADESGRLYFPCSNGLHGIDGQINQAGRLSGLKRA